MGTLAIIAIKNGNDITWSSVNKDGYPAGVGKTLLQYYNDADRARALIALGDLSVLGKSIDQPAGHSFSNPVAGYTVAYIRDAGEHLSHAYNHQTADWAMFLHANDNIQYCYMFEGDAWFMCRKVKSTGKFVERFELFRLGEVLSGLHDK